MAIQTFNIKNEAKFDSKDAIALELQPLSPTEILLIGENYVQIFRAARTKFQVAEVLRFEGLKGEPLRGDRLEVVRVSPTRFIIQDQFVYERLPDDYRSQFHVFDLIDGQYRLTSSKLLDGRRMFSSTVLTNGQIMVDVRPFADRQVPRIQILDLGPIN